MADDDSLPLDVGLQGEEFDFGPLQETVVHFQEWGTETQLSIATLNVQNLFGNWEYVHQIVQQKAAHIFVIQ